MNIMKNQKIKRIEKSKETLLIIKSSKIVDQLKFKSFLLQLQQDGSFVVNVANVSNNDLEYTINYIRTLFLKMNIEIKEIMTQESTLNNISIN